MSEAIVRLVKIHMSKPSSIKDGEKELQEALSMGFEMPNPPVALGDTHLVYTLLHPRVQERIDFKTAYPSQKQQGYVCWAYGISDTVFTEAKISKQECSKLIDGHQESGNNKPFKRGAFKKALTEIRGAEQEDDEYNDDIPF